MHFLQCLGYLVIGSITVSASFTMTPSNTLADGKSFAVYSTASLTCTNQPYAGSQIWIFDSVKVAECGLISCVENLSNPSRFSFMNNISAGIFVFTIDPVLKTDDTKVIECYDRTVSATISFTLNVEGEGSTASDDSSITLVIVVCSVGGLIVTCLCILHYYKVKQSGNLRQALQTNKEWDGKVVNAKSNQNPWTSHAKGVYETYCETLKKEYDVEMSSKHEDQESDVDETTSFLPPGTKTLPAYDHTDDTERHSGIASSENGLYGELFQQHLRARNLKSFKN